jgi:hypothetical protein
LLDIAEKGEWEKFDGLHHELLLLMETLRSTVRLDPKQPDSIVQVERIQQLLQKTIALCSERKDQIAPLVNAFAKAIDTPTSP